MNETNTNTGMSHLPTGAKRILSIHASAYRSMVLDSKAISFSHSVHPLPHDYYISLKQDSRITKSGRTNPYFIPPTMAFLASPNLRPGTPQGGRGETLALTRGAKQIRGLLFVPFCSIPPKLGCSKAILNPWVVKGSPGFALGAMD